MRSPARVAAALALWIVQLIVTAVLSVFMFFSLFATVSCDSASCDFPTYALITRVFFDGAVILAAATVVCIILLRRDPDAVVWPPVFATALVIVLTCVTYPLSRAALDLPLFDGRAPL